MNRLTVEEMAARFLACEDVHILIHQAPDGDCIGAGYSLQAVLRQLGKRAQVLCCDPIPPRFGFLLPEGEEETFSPQTVIAVDVADEKLFGSLADTYGGRVDLCVDHHISNKGYAKALLLESDASAACEVLYKVYRAMGVTFTEPIVKCLYTGMATDTGCFKFSNASASTHRAVADLMDLCPDIRYDLINRAMFDVKSPGRLRAEMAMLSHMEYHLDGRLTIIWATIDVMHANDVDEMDMEGLANLPLAPEGVEVGVTMREREPGVFKVSMRAAGDVDVSAICQTFGGGGHVKAAGCLLEGTQDDLRDRVIAAVRRAL
ncbi:MAG: bifunctional oligoribonuclease/PAP phosphatase NrnA [Oscillospiraceae bacterium]|nr:bifunctional oligoribonuclease/PAP phosphatase NrnA [Oscillospiraceae bacterium]